MVGTAGLRYGGARATNVLVKGVWVCEYVSVGASACKPWYRDRAKMIAFIVKRIEVWGVEFRLLGRELGPEMQGVQKGGGRGGT